MGQRVSSREKFLIARQIRESFGGHKPLLALSNEMRRPGGV